MCFGSKDNIHEEDAPRPAQFPPPQPTYASTPAKASLPVSPVSAASPAYLHQQHAPQQQQQQHQPPPMAELSAPERNRVELSGDEIAPPPGPPPSHRQAADEFAPPPGPPLAARNQHDDVAPPPGPPPSHRADDFAPPPGPPPSQSNNPFRQQQPTATTHTSDFSPPPGPPPAFSGKGGGGDDYTAPPPGPPPSHSKPAAHDWETLVPDTSLFPPPPDIFSGYDRSPATNATEAEAEAGEAWCAAHPLSPPLDLDASVLDGRRVGSVRLMAPEAGQPFKGKLEWMGGGVWRGRTDKQAGDYCYIGYPPLYAVKRDSPLVSGKGGKRTVYYEIRVLPDNKKEGEISIAIGYAALPYPSFRMPGWHRGSLAVHGDDGHKYINDRWGGKEFTQPMKRGETYGLGMVFKVVEATGRIETEVFYTREGREVGRWNLHEETDAEQDLPVTGLEGYHDLAAAVGSFGGCSWEAVFEPGRWKYREVANEVY
ncbi:SPRY domain-containing protein [Coniochaeta hoffmannii]|uniref:SPRY domain-containing protein n=1 Tax=Coniochaeta hoffmannii TaxID=91930 RepID=A0AA38VUQ0_9PEZI|nr:SPRY domain-containing protein [Coniochaeta hoffmannii]